MVRQKIFCVIGEAYSDRQKILKKIKAEVFQGKSTPLNTTILYPRYLDLQKLREVLLHFSFEGRKLIIFKDAAMLSSQCKAFLYKELDRINVPGYLVFEIERNPSEFMRDKEVAKTPLFQYILTHGIIVKSQSFKGNATFFQLLSAIRKYQVAKALYILEELFLEFKNDRMLSMHIMGALVRHVSSLSNVHQREKYLAHIWYVDRLIKEKGIEPKLALEIAIMEMLTG